MDPELDSSSCVQGISDAALKTIKHKMHQHQLSDVWRIMHPKTQDYMFFSPVHGTYTRIDYIMVDHKALELVTESNIEISTLSDNSPVTMKIRVTGIQRPAYNWRLNESLIQNKKDVQIVQKALDYDTKETSHATLWEAHKAHIRGIFISLGTVKKKERTKNMKSVLDEVFRLEQEHKKYKGRHQETFHQLVVKRDELKDLIAQDTKRTFNRILKDRYQWGNKMSIHLARI